MAGEPYQKDGDYASYLKHCMDVAKNRALSQTPSSSASVEGIGEAEAKNKRLLSEQPSASKTVPGMPGKLK